jgi:hypothetical protein
VVNIKVIYIVSGEKFQVGLGLAIESVTYGNTT